LAGLRPRRRRLDMWAACCSCLLYAGLGPLAARDPARWERVSFHRLNGAGGALPILRLPQQFGTPWLLPAIAIGAFCADLPYLVVAAGLALPVEKSMEVGLKRLTRRRRPAEAMQPELHDDAPTDGPSYPSGHAAIASCAAVLVAPYLPVPASGATATVVAMTAWRRVYQGAHFPLDAIGGICLGVGVGSLLNFGVGLPSRRQGRVQREIG
jgi:membrane-associated phospholipid phosphatase